MRRPALILAAAAIALAMGILLVEPVGVLAVRVLRPASSTMYACRVTAGADVRIGYLHSVERTPVEGRFVVGENNLLMAVETRFASTGTGLPNTAAARTHRDGRWIVVDEGRRSTTALRFYLHADNRTWLTVDGKAVDLGAFASGNLLNIGVEVVPRWRWLMWITAGRPWTPSVEAEK